MTTSSNPTWQPGDEAFVLRDGKPFFKTTVVESFDFTPGVTTPRHFTPFVVTEDGQRFALAPAANVWVCREDAWLTLIPATDEAIAEIRQAKRAERNAARLRKQGADELRKVCERAEHALRSRMGEVSTEQARVAAQRRYVRMAEEALERTQADLKRVLDPQRMVNINQHIAEAQSALYAAQRDLAEHLDAPKDEQQ